MKSPPIAVLSSFVTALALVALTQIAGCDSKRSGNEAAESGSANDPAAAPDEKPVDDVVEAQPFRDIWEAHYLQGTKFGHSHTTHTRGKLGDEPIVKIEQQSRFTVLNDGRQVEQVAKQVSWETEAGDVRRFESMVIQGPSPRITRGTVQGNEATYSVMTSSRTESHTIHWPTGTRGPMAIVDDLLLRPMKPGETRELATFLLEMNKVARVTLKARDKQSTAVGNEPRELLKIDSTATLDGDLKIESILWTDDAGNVVKTELPALHHTSVQTTAAGAVAVDDTAPQVDLGRSTMVKLAAKLPGGHETTLVRYRIELPGGDVVGALPSCESQTVKKLDGNAAEITVTAVRPESPLPAGYAPKPASIADLSSNSLVQSDDPKIKAMAKSGAGTETEPWKKAEALEKYVHELMTTTQFSPAFGSALDTAKTLKGDCTEYALLLCALLRASDIPARGAIGLVYVDRQQALLYHMWVEAYIGGRWIGLDATRGAGGLSASYLKISDATLEPTDPYAGLLKIFNIVGRLKVDVIEAK